MITWVTQSGKSLSHLWIGKNSIHGIQLYRGPEKTYLHSVSTARCPEACGGMKSPLNRSVGHCAPTNLILSSCSNAQGLYLCTPQQLQQLRGYPHTSAARFSGKQSFQSKDKHTHQQQMKQNSWNEQREGHGGSNAILKALCPICIADSCTKSCLARIIWSQLEVWERWHGRGLLGMCVCAWYLCDDINQAGKLNSLAKSSRQFSRRYIGLRITLEACPLQRTVSFGK